jgi:ketosteroid isomerase-like protein
LTEETVQIVRRAFEAYACGDVESLLCLLDPGVEVRSLMTEAERTTFHGHRGVREWFAAVLDIFPDWCPTPGRVRVFGEAVVVAFHVTATAARSGVTVDQTYWQGSRLRNGKIVYFGFFRSEGDALQAVGVGAGPPGASDP